MKGVCIVMVVFYHTDCYQGSAMESAHPTLGMMMHCMRMPLYFCLSGLFFSTYTGFADFLTRKTQKLLLPLLFFCVFPQVLFDYHEDTEMDYTYWRDMFCVPLNNPMWFLICLYFSYILYYCFTVISRRWSDILRHAVILLLPALVATLYMPHYWGVRTLATNVHVLKIPIIYCHLLTSFIVLPIIHTAVMLRRHGILSVSLGHRVTAALFVMFCFLWWAFSVGNVDLNMNMYGDNYLFFYASAMCGIGAVWTVCRTLRHVPVLSYLGRYSIVVLGMHGPMLQYAIHQLHITDCYLLTLGILALTIPMIWLLTRLFPWLTAQRDIVEWRDGGLHWHRG